MKYLDYVNLNYKPSKDDLICLFRVEPAKGISIKEAAGRIASESSTGTWAEKLSTETESVKKRLEEISAKVFEIKGNWIKIAYPTKLFEPGNIPQILSSIAGNVFGMKAVKNLRLEDVFWPRVLVKSFKGPQFGIEGIRKMFGVYDRPLTATVPKPKVGLVSDEYCKVAYEIWKGGIDFVKMDENLTSQKFIDFYKTTEKILKVRGVVEKETGEKKVYLANVTAECKEMLRRTEFVWKNGGEIVMVDALTAGWSAVQTLREVCEELGIAMYMHRAFHSTFTRNVKHGLSMLVVAEIARLIGFDAVHIGGLGKLVSSRDEIFVLKEKIQEKTSQPKNKILGKNWCGFKPLFGVTSGGLHPGIIPRLIKLLGKDIIIQVGGGVMGHPMGVIAGGKAVRQAIEASIKNISLKEFAKKHKELDVALKKWGSLTPV